MSNDTTEKEALERFSDGLKKASSRARQLGHAQKSKHWLKIASGLELIRVNGLKMANGKPLSRQEVIEKIDSRQNYLLKKQQAEQGKPH